ncbi:MAG: sugar ABC transporter permease [Chloroflexota bacterium]|nr:sugar ABC transporter permease [Chloroflexota bacterium]MDE2910284.1 sugar ABC transporter permease [Chloroflexota bacterium]
MHKSGLLPELTPRHREAFVGYLFILPTYIGFTIFILYPLIESVRISFQEFSLLRGSTYIGFDNYAQMFADGRLRIAYINTVIFTLFAVFFNAGIGLILAVMLNRRLPVLMRNLYRSIFFFPVLIAHTYIAVIWRFLYQQDTGVINYYLGLFGVDAIPWLSNAHWAMAAIIILDVWKNTGFAMLVFLAGLQSIPNEYYEAAQLDGANERQLFFRITIPLLSPTIFFILVIFMIGALQVFDTIIVLTQGGPGDATRSVVLYVYEIAFRTFNMGYAAAVSMTLFAIILVLTALQFWISRRWVHYE